MVVKTSGLYVGLGKYYVIAACFNSVLKFPVHLLVGESVNLSCLGVPHAMVRVT